MENYYKILEVDRDASPETIEKVYKILVKKYHPDLQTGNDKLIAEEKIKKINEAYAILSDTSKRANYNNELGTSDISNAEYTRIIKENDLLKNEVNILRDKVSKFTQYYSIQQEQQQRHQPNQQQYYNQNYNNGTSGNYTYTYVKKRSWLKKLFRIVFILLILAIIGFLIYKLPYFSNVRKVLFNPNLLFAIFIIYIFTYGSKR